MQDLGEIDTASRFDLVSNLPEVSAIQVSRKLFVYPFLLQQSHHFEAVFVLEIAQELGLTTGRIVVGDAGALEKRLDFQTETIHCY